MREHLRTKQAATERNEGLRERPLGSYGRNLAALQQGLPEKNLDSVTPALIDPDFHDADRREEVA